MCYRTTLRAATRNPAVATAARVVAELYWAHAARVFYTYVAGDPYDWHNLRAYYRGLLAAVPANLRPAVDFLAEHIMANES